jgi:BirA family transcriptional regulator, biotin operon repressor / biotin---[acetyl-CoA-carboxylase] ligase
MSNVIRSDHEGDLVISEVQTGGRGREGRSWISRKGGLWMTITLKPASRVLERIVYTGARAIVRTLEEHGVTGTVEPPNDVYCNGKKIAGLLADTTIKAGNLTLLLGVGIDVNNEIDESISEIATSVKVQTKREVDLKEFTLSFLKNLDKEYNAEIKSQDTQNSISTKS